MYTDILDIIILLCEDENLNGKLYKDKFNDYCDFFDSVNDYDEFNKVNWGFFLAKISALILDLTIDSSKIRRSKRKIVSELFGIDKDKITGNYSSFINSKVDYEVFVDDFSYSAVVPKDKLNRLSIVWGNANFQKLHDLENLHNLKVVMGDVHFSDAINVENFTNLEIVTGDVYLDDIDSVRILDNLSYLGGDIYIRGEVLNNSGKAKIR